MASSNSTFRSRPDLAADAAADRERDQEEDDVVAPGRLPLTRYLRRPQGEGRPLPAAMADALSGKLGPLHDVRVHDDARASAMVRSMGAAGFTYGRQIYLREGASQDVLAHEVAHAAQHQGGAPRGPIEIGGESHAEDYADRVAASRYAPDMRIEAPAAAPARVRFKSVDDVDVVPLIAKEMGTNKAKAAQMLRKAPSGNRGPVEAAVRQNFSADDAKDLIEKNPSGGGAPPAVNGKEVAASQTADKKGEGKSGHAAHHGGPAGPGAGKHGGGGAAPATAPAAKHDEPPPPQPDPDLAGSSTEGLALIQQELTEHEKWKEETKEAQDKVGDAGSLQRLEFVMKEAGKGALSGAVTGAVTAVATKAITFGAVKLVGKEIPGLGAVLAGGMSAYSLATKNWKESGEKIGAFGQGADAYEKLANSLAAIGEIIDIVLNILNVIAGVIAIVAGVMWLVTLITLGAASPLAATLTSIAGGIVAVTTIMDAINRGCIQPLVLLFRMMHTFTNKADPRDVEEEGDGISEAASDAASFFAGKAAEKGMESLGGGEGADAKKGSGPDQGKSTPKTEAPKTEAPKTEAPKTEAPKTEAPKPEAENEHAGKGDGKPHGEDENEPKKQTKQQREQEEQRKQQEKEAEAKKKIEAAEEEKKKLAGQRKTVDDEHEQLESEKQDKVEEARKKVVEDAEKKAHDEAKAKHAEIKQKLDEDLAKIDATAKTDAEGLKQAHAAREAAVAKAAGEARAAEVKAADSTRAEEIKAAQDARDAAKRANAERAQKIAAKESPELEAKAKSVEAGHEAALTKLGEISDPELRAKAIADENAKYADAKASIDAERVQAHDQAKARAEAVQSSADGYADTKYKQAVDAADAKAEHAKAAAQADEAKKIDSVKAESAAEDKALEEQTARQKADAQASAASDGANADAKEESDVEAGKKAGNKAAAEESARIKKKLADLQKESNKLRAEEAEKAREAAEIKDKELPKTGLQKVAGFYGIKGAESFKTVGAHEGAQTIDLSIVGGKTRGSLVNPALDKLHDGLAPKAKADPEFDKRGVVENVKDAPADFRKGVKEGREKKERPRLPDPPGSLEQLEALKAKIAQDLKVRAEYEKYEHHNAATEKDERANAAKLQQAGAMSKQVIGISDQHKTKVGEKETAIAQQKQKQQQAQSTLQEKSGQMSGVSAVTVPLKAFNGFLWLAEKLPGSVGAKMHKMHEDGENMLKQFESINGKLADGKSNNAAAGQKLVADKATNDKTKTKAAATGVSLTSTDAKVKQMGTSVAANAATAAGEKTKAAQGKQAADAAAKKGEGDYKQLMAQLQAWAQNHRALRMQAEKGEKKEEGAPAGGGE
jgi:hypothetical protein